MGKIEKWKIIIGGCDSKKANKTVELLIIQLLQEKTE